MSPSAPSPTSSLIIISVGKVYDVKKANNHAKSQKTETPCFKDLI
jgi:hypothetical protein